MKKDRMSRSLRICVWMMVIALFLAGCGTTDSAPPKETASQVPDVTEQLIQMQTEPIPTEAAPTEPVLTEIIDNGNRPGEDDGFVHSHPLGTTVSYDLNGDGLDEDITVQAQEYGDGLLMIGNTSLEFEAISPAGYFTVVNIDQSQRILLVGISDYGFSDDDMTVLYAYDGAEIAEVGFFGDILGENSYNRYFGHLECLRTVPAGRSRPGGSYGSVSVRRLGRQYHRLGSYHKDGTDYVHRQRADR